MFNETRAFSGFSVDDIEKTREFYGTTLGLPCTESKEGLDIKLHGGGAVFLYPKKDHAPATFTVLNFVVEDIDSAVDGLKEKGVTLENYDNGPMKADGKGIYRGKESGHGPDIAWFKDPSGNILSVLEEADKT